MRRAAWTAVAITSVAVTALPAPGVEALRPEIALSMEAGGVVRIRSWVTPVGPAGYRDRPAELQWMLMPEGASWRIVAAFAEALTLDPGEERMFVDWRIQLPGGTYSLTWGDPCEGTIAVSFSVAEDETGSRMLTAPGRFLSPLTPFAASLADAPAWKADPEARRAAAWARAAWAEDLAVCARRIEVVEVLSREFSDTSLGVREPGMFYAQVITPGFVVRLAWQGRAAEYRVAGGRMVRVPDVPAGEVPDELWVVNVFAYHAGVDSLLHGHTACSPEAVLPLARRVPLTAWPLEAALRLLAAGGLAPWEVAAGYSSEFPLPGVSLEAVYVEDGVVTVVLADPEHRTSGGACRTGILRAQIEKTALQFPEVEEVRILPPEALQP
ncbi:MAG: hypothetical protein Kow0097_03930 [Candidatus Bipolaricaulota bacterium]